MWAPFASSRCATPRGYRVTPVRRIVMWNQSNTCSAACVMRSVKCAYFLAAVAQESHVLVGLQALAFERVE